jgi:CheY-like chemotaxis protein
VTVVVIVEDDPLVAKYLKYVVEQLGEHEVVLTESGDHAFALASDLRTAALLIDVSLRDTSLQGRHIDGLELTRALKANVTTARVPTIITTARTMAGDRERFLQESGADAFLQKPITSAAEVLSLLHAVTGGTLR